MKKQFQSKSVPRGTRTIWRYLGALFILFTFAIGQMWGADITVTPPTPNNASNPFSTGLYVMSFSGTGSKLSSGAITTGTKGAVITINFQATKSDMYIKTITFNSLGNGTLSSDDGTFDGQVFTATGNKNSVNVVLTSGSGQKGTVKVTNVVVNTGTNVVESITFTGVDSGDGKKATFTSSVATSALSSITTDASAFSVSSGKLSWTNGKKVILTAESNIKYVAFSIADGKMYSTFSATEDTYNSANYSWSGSSKTVTLTNGSGGGREIKGLYVIIDPVVKHHVTYSLGGDYGTTPTQADVAEGGKFTLHNGTTGITAPDNKAFAGWNDGTTTYAGGAEYTMGDDDVTLTAQWSPAYDITYNKGAYGTGEIAGGTKAEDVAYTLSSSMFTRENYLQVGWTTTDGESRSYMMGGSYTTNAAQVFYPAWAEKDTYVAEFTYDSGNPAAPAGWTFSTGDHGATSTSVDYEGVFGGTCPASGSAANVNYIAFAKNAGAYATYDLGYVTTVSAVTGTFYVGSSNERTFKIEYIASDGTTVLHTISTTTNSNWGEKAVNETAIVPNVRYIKISSARNGNDFSWLVMSAFSVTYGSLVTKYNVTFDKNGGSGDDMATLKYAEGAEVTLPACSFTAPTNKEFDAWTSTDVTISNNKFTMPAKDVTIKATWKALVAKYTVIFKDGDVTLGTKQFDVASNPSDAEIDKTKPMFTFAAWQKDEADIALDAAFWATVAKDAEVTLTARWEKAYAQSIDMEQFVMDNTKAGNWHAYLDSKGYAYASSNMSLDSLDGGKTKNNYQYLGLKFNKNSENTYVEGNLQAQKLMIVKVGAVGNNTYMKIDGAKVAEPAIVGGVEADSAAAYTYWYYDTDKTFSLFHENGGTSMLKGITITDPYQVTFDANGGDPVAPQNGTPSVTLPLPVKGTESFLGWFDGETNVGMNGDKYTPTADITLKAHWEAISTDARLASISFSSNAGTLSPAFDPEVTAYTYTMPYKTAAIPTITGATSVSDKAKAPVIDAQAANWGDVAHIHGVAQSDDTKDYYITMLQAPKDGVEIIGVVTTGGNNKTVSGLYKGDAAVNLDGDKKIGSGKYIYVTLASGYTFEETDVLVVDVKAKSDLPSSPALEITTGVGNIDGSVWKSIANADYELNLVTIPLTGIAANQTSIGLKRSDHQNTWVNGLKVYRPMMPMLTAITINGVDCEKGTGNTFTITLPEATTDLAALTVVPTIVWNAAATENSIVVNNGAAWHEGANSYKLTDKDGDATTYTITITLQGEAPAPVIATQPAGVAYCAGSEPTLEVVATGDELHYAWFKEAGETDEAVGSDQASYTVEAAGTYYVIVTNHVDGKLDKSITSANAVVTLNTAAAITKQPVNKRDIVSGASVTLSVEATNATGYQWYICDDAEKANASAISGAEAANYVFNCSANAFYYCVVGNACGADLESNVVSVKLEPVGCNVLDGTIPSAAPYIYDNGEWTLYAVTSGGKLDGTSRFDDDAKDFDGNTVNAITYGRVGMTFAKDVESLTIYATSSSSDRAISSIKVTTDDVTTGTPSYSDVTFTASAEKLGKKDSSSPYRFVLEANNMLLEAGKKYWLQFSGTVSAFKICYSEALAMPALPTLVNQELCAGAAYQEFDATITNEAACEGTVSYQWYNAANDEAIEGANVATFTPSTDGTYYVVVTHAKAGHITRTAQSANLSVAHFDALTLVSHSDDVFQHMGTAATLSVVATGKNVAYVWYTCSNAAGDDAVAIDPAETEAELAIASILEGVHYYKVVISHDCDATTLSHVFKVEGWDQLEQVDVTESTVWDMNNVSASEINLASMTPSKQNVLLLLANIEGVNNNASFNSQALMFEGQRIGRTENNVKYVSGQYVQFNVTVPGMVSVTFASNGSAQRTILINGKQCSRTTNDGTYIKYDVAVEPGSVEIEDVQGYVRISKIEFKAEDSYHRAVNPSYLGTLCWTNNAILGGATLYEFAGKNEYNYLVFDEVAENRLEAGKPYIFMPENGSTEIKVYNTDNEAAKTESELQPVNHMYGTVEGKTLVPGVDDNMYYFSASHIWAVKDFTVSINVPAYYCYVDYEAVLNDEPAQAPAPGRRRVTMGVQGQQVATGIEDVQGDKVQCTKMLINGQLFILRGEKMYDAKGQLVK